MKNVSAMSFPPLNGLKPKFSYRVRNLYYYKPQIDKKKKKKKKKQCKRALIKNFTVQKYLIFEKAIVYTVTIFKSVSSNDAKFSVCMRRCHACGTEITLIKTQCMHTVVGMMPNSVFAYSALKGAKLTKPLNETVYLERNLLSDSCQNL